MTSRNTPGRRASAALLPGLLALGLLALAAGAYALDLLTVVQRETFIRKEKRQLSAKVAVVHEGDRVAKIGEEGSWLQVEFNGAQGWLPASSVSSDRKVVLSNEAVASGVRATEQSAGARGFNPQVEARYKTSRADLAQAYRILDRIQERKFSEDKVAQFILEGKLGEQVADARIEERRPAPPWKR